MRLRRTRRGHQNPSLRRHRGDLRQTNQTPPHGSLHASHHHEALQRQTRATRHRHIHRTLPLLPGHLHTGRIPHPPPRSPHRRLRHERKRRLQTVRKRIKRRHQHHADLRLKRQTPPNHRQAPRHQSRQSRLQRKPPPQHPPRRRHPRRL